MARKADAVTRRGIQTKQRSIEEKTAGRASEYAGESP